MKYKSCGVAAGLGILAFASCTILAWIPIIEEGRLDVKTPSGRIYYDSNTGTGEILLNGHELGIDSQAGCIVDEREFNSQWCWKR